MIAPYKTWTAHALCAVHIYSSLPKIFFSASDEQEAEEAPGPFCYLLLIAGSWLAHLGVGETPGGRDDSCRVCAAAGKSLSLGYAPARHFTEQEPAWETAATAVSTHSFMFCGPVFGFCADYWICVLDRRNSCMGLYMSVKGQYMCLFGSICGWWDSICGWRGSIYWG